MVAMASLLAAGGSALSAAYAATRAPRQPHPRLVTRQALPMTVTFHNIAGTDAPFGYHHATAARGTTIVHVSGQPGVDEHGVVAGGLAAQTEQAMVNVAKAL